jgi:hypothetical protein
MERNDEHVDEQDIAEGCRSCVLTGKCDSEAECRRQWTLDELTKTFKDYPYPHYVRPKRAAPKGTGDFPWDPSQWQCEFQ